MVRRVGMAHVELNDAAKRYVSDCLETGMIARGKYIEQFEESLAEYTGGRYAIAVCNGTLADVLLLRAMVELFGYSRVEMPALTFAAQLSAVLDAGLVPTFVDVTEDLQPLHNIRTEDDTLPFTTSLMGAICRCPPPGACIDSCECFARGIADGQYAITISTYATHAVATGEGGAIITNDANVAEVCRSLRDHGQEPGGVLDKFRHKRQGYNAKMSNVLAAIGCGMMEEADDLVAARRQVAKMYDERLAGEWFDKLASPHGYPIACETKAERDRLLLKLEDNGVEARRQFSVLANDEPAFAWLAPVGMFPSARRIADTWLYLPCHAGVTEEDVDYIVGLLP